MRYILEAVSKPRPAVLPLLLLPPHLADSRRVSPDISGLVRALFRTCGRDAARGMTLNLIRGGHRVCSYVRTHLLTVRAVAASRVEVIGSRCMHFRTVSGSSLSSPTGSSEDLGGFARRVRVKRFIRHCSPMSPEMFYAR